MKDFCTENGVSDARVCCEIGPNSCVFGPLKNRIGTYSAYDVMIQPHSLKTALKSITFLTEDNDMRMEPKGTPVGGRRSRKQDVITQTDIQQYIKAADVAKEFNRIRERFIKRLGAGAKIEIGPLNAELEMQPGSQLSWSRLEEYLDPDVFEQLKGDYEGNPRRYVHVTCYGRNIR